jgi:cysteine-rich repeat protein
MKNKIWIALVLISAVLFSILFMFNDFATINFSPKKSAFDSGNRPTQIPSPYQCGNGNVEQPVNEECDDGNTISGDGCGASCLNEDGWICRGEPSNCVEFDLELEQPVNTNGLEDLTYVVHSGDASERLFFVEKAGKIWTYETLNPGFGLLPFLDIEERIDDFGYKGLLSIAFHPNYANEEDRKFYVAYTNEEVELIISEFGILSYPYAADETSERIILEIPYADALENFGGQLQFGPDGYLYISTGYGNDFESGQDVNSLQASLLRIDVDVSSGLGYGIPSDNPFVGKNGADEIYAYGFRSPWRFSFDQDTGKLFLADVGASLWEEINLIESGGNYGWCAMEGSVCHAGCNCNVQNTKLPIYKYNSHPPENPECAIVGGYVYRGNLIPDLKGVYVFGDFCTSRIWGLFESIPGVWVDSEFVLDPELGGFGISSFGEGENGEIYVMRFGGEVFKIESD